MKKVFLLTLLVLFGTFEVKAAFKKNEKRILSNEGWVKGAWAGQTLGGYGGILNSNSWELLFRIIFPFLGMNTW